MIEGRRKREGTISGMWMGGKRGIIRVKICKDVKKEE
jgi:hypothetical protein